jgi:hypothetical protein
MIQQVPRDLSRCVIVRNVTLVVSGQWSVVKKSEGTPSAYEHHSPSQSVNMQFNMTNVKFFLQSSAAKNARFLRMASKMHT